VKIVGAIVRWDQGNVSNCVQFNEAKKCMSLKGEAQRFQYNAQDYVLEPGKEVYIVPSCVTWLTHDNSSPFKRDASLYVHPDDSPIDIEKVKAVRAKVVQAKEEVEQVPDGRPDAEWRPAHLAALYKMLDPEGMPVSAFMVMKPPDKAKALAGYMAKKGMTLKGGKLVTEVRV